MYVAMKSFSEICPHSPRGMIYRQSKYLQDAHFFLAKLNVMNYHDAVQNNDALTHLVLDYDYMKQLRLDLQTFEFSHSFLTTFLTISIFDKLHINNYM